MKNSIGFNLTSLSDEKLTPELIEKFNQITFDFFQRHGVIPTYWWVEGKGFGDKLTKFTSKKLQNLREKNYLDRGRKLIEGLGYAINPKESDAPAFDSFLKLGLIYTKELQRLELTFTIDPNIIPVTPKEIGELFLEYARLFVVDFGFIYEHESFEHVNAVVIGYNDNNYSKEEWEPYLRWYQSPTEEKLRHPRNLFPVNLLRRDLYKEAIEKILRGDREFFDSYHYRGKGFVEHPLPKELSYLACLVEREHTYYCD